MATLKSCKYEEGLARKVTEGAQGHTEYPMSWMAIVDTHDLHGKEVLALARAATPGPGFDPVPQKVGSKWSFRRGDGDMVEDSGAEAQMITCEVIDPSNDLIWKITADYSTLETSGNLNFGGPVPADPMLWPVRHWLERVDEQSVIEVAKCLTYLDHLKRGWNFENEPGPIINAAGQQTVDPQMRQGYRIIFHILINYPNALYAVALNNQFGDTVHAPDDALELLKEPPEETVPKLLMGCPHFTWKFLAAHTEKAQFREVEVEGQPVEELETTEYYATDLEFELKFGPWINLLIGDNPGVLHTMRAGWIRPVLNNGQTCFRKWLDKYIDPDGSDPVYIQDPRRPVDPQTGVRPPMLLPCTALQVKGDFDLGFDDNRSSPTTPRAQPQLTDMEEVEVSEPVNLKLSGEQITDPGELAGYVLYTDLVPADYYKITDYFGNKVFPENVELPVFPLSPP